MIILYPMRPLSLDYSGRLRLYGGRGSDIYYLWWLWSAALSTPTRVSIIIIRV